MHSCFKIDLKCDTSFFQSAAKTGQGCILWYFYYNKCLLEFLEYNISKCWHRLKTVFCIHVLCCFNLVALASFVYYCYSIFVLMYKYSSPMFKTILNHDFHDNLQCRDFNWHIQVYTANIIKYTPGPSTSFRKQRNGTFNKS
jgi:thiosulfate reductase cytochrome b subunit